MRMNGLEAWVRWVLFGLRRKARRSGCRWAWRWADGVFGRVFGYARWIRVVEAREGPSGGPATRTLEVVALDAGRGGWLALREAVERGASDGVVVSEGPVVWREGALEALRSAWDGAARMVYADHDRWVGGRRTDPFFAPAWDPVLMAHYDLTGGVCAFDRAVLREALRSMDSPPPALRALTLRVAEAVGDAAIRHVPRVLFSREAPCPHGAAASPGLAVGAVHPLVSLIVPTRDAPGLLRTCVESVERVTEYPALEWVLVDHESVEPAAGFIAAMEKRPNVRVARVSGPFNFSAMINAGARPARGEVLVLLNNDCEAIAAGWLDELVAWAMRPGIGVVGAKLLYPNRTIEHAGLVLGVHRVAAHAFEFYPDGWPGLPAWLAYPRTCSAVTAACCAVRKTVFEQVGGFDETHLPVNFNDVDFALRVREAGLRNVWTPHAVLLHHKSATRGRGAFPEQEAATMERRWGAMLRADPAYSVHWARDTEPYDLGWGRARP